MELYLKRPEIRRIKGLLEHLASIVLGNLRNNPLIPTGNGELSQSP
jgi:hypothetical protein